MEYINKHIIQELGKQASLIYDSPLKTRINNEKIQKKKDFEMWLKNIRISMHMCKYRQVVNEIESRKDNFRLIPEEHWRYYVIEMDAIFKILKKKFIHHQIEISKENSHQNHSCMFWLNQMYLILEKLILIFRPDINHKLDFNNESIMKPIQCIIEGYIKLIFCLIVFSQYNHQIHEICAYLSMIDRIIPYMNYTTKSNSYIYFQKIQLLKVKLFIENCDYLSAMEAIKKNIYFCCDYIRLFGDEDFNIYYNEHYGDKYRRYNDNLTSQEYTINNTYNNKNTEKNKNRKLINKKIKKMDSKLNSPTKSNKNFKFSDKNLLVNITSKSPIKYNNSSLESLSNKGDNNTIHRMKSKESNNLQINNATLENAEVNNKLNEQQEKKDAFITQIKRKMKIQRYSNRPIEDILSNIALNFYLRGAIFEHLGNLDSALDSYKEVEWFSLKFLTKKLPNFVKYMSNLLTCAYNNYNLITRIKIEKQKKRNMRLLLCEKEEIKGGLKLKKNLFKRSSLNFNNNYRNNNRQLKNYLDNIGKELYKEEETRNFNLYNKFTKTGYILSTVKMIDDLLSNDFKDVLKKMKKIEITKPREEIKELINKIIIKKNQKSFDDQTVINTKGSLNNINAIKKDNYDSTIINNCLNKDNNQNFNIKNRNKNLICLKKENIKTIHIKSDSINLDSSNKKYSISCKISNQSTKRFSGFSSDEFRKHNLEKIYNYSNIEENKSNVNIINTKKYHITKVNSKVNSGLSSSRSSHSKEKVQKYPMDKENFNKGFIKKKNFLDGFYNKEFKFHKNLLKTKSCPREFFKPPNDFDIKKVIEDAELNFSIKYEIAKSGRGKKNLNNLLKQNLNVINKNLQNNKLIRLTSPKFSNDNNEMKLKELNLDYIQIISKRNELIKRKKNIILGNLVSY